MKTRTLFMCWLLSHLMPAPLNGQTFYNTWYYNYDLVWEAGTGAGLMNCLTDIGGRKGNGGRFLKDADWSASRPCLNLFVAATYKDRWTIRLSWQSGSVHAADSVLKHSDPDANGRYGRNLSFRSRISEVSLVAEAHPLFWNLDPQDKIPSFSPYLLAGLGYYRFNPQALLGGQWHDLQPLRLEGQGMPGPENRQPYSLQQFSIPVGAGIRYETGPLLNIRFDCIYRFLFTDYLDDVSTTYINAAYFDQYLEREQAAIARQLHNRMNERRPGSAVAAGSQRGNPKNKDAFFSFQVTVSYVFRNRVK